MNPVVGVLTFGLLAALQAVLAQYLAPYPGVRPHLVVLAAVSCGLLNGPRSGAIWGAVGGLALDLVSAGPLGAATAPLALVGFFSGFGHLPELRMNRLLPLEAAFVAPVVFDLLRMLLLQVSGWDLNWIVAIYEVVLPSAVASVAVMPLVYALLFWLRRRSRQRPEMGW